MTHRIGIDLGGTKISGVVLDPAGNELTRERRPTPRGDYDGTLTAVAELVAALESAAGLAPGSATVGIGTPGTWQPRLERMKNCNSTWLNDRPLLHDLERRLGERVLVANDADCLGLSEAIDGTGADAKSVFAVILGTGVGGAFVLRGRLVQGPNGLAGEWGHVPLPYFRTQALWERSPDGESGTGSRSGDRSHGETEARRYEEGLFQLESQLEDRRCYCGRMNCIETFLSGPGLAATHQALWGEAKAAADIAEAVDERSSSTLRLYQHMLARSLAQVVNLIDPAVIVLGGGVSNVTRLYPVLESLIPMYAFSSVRGASRHVDDDVRVTVRRARWGDDSGVRGAARLWEVKA